MKNALLLSLVLSVAGGGSALAYQGPRSTTEAQKVEARVSKARVVESRSSKLRKAPSAEARLRRADKNDDGKIAGAELKRLTPGLVARFDKNHDGVLSPGELKAKRKEASAPVSAALAKRAKATAVSRDKEKTPEATTARGSAKMRASSEAARAKVRSLAVDSQR